MCGFAGYLLSEKKWESQENTVVDLSNISKKIFHRGPDDKGILVDEKNKLGIAFQRLSILDLSKNARQPMVSNCKKWIIVFNGEIYNYRELKKNLSEKTSVWNTNSDTEVILECITKYGFSKAISMLDGMFAIAAFCVIDKSLWLARDKFGEKPLYYCNDKNNNFFFSSDIKALMASRYYDKKIDYSISNDYIRYGYVPDPLCILEKTYKLSPGMILKFNSNKKIKIDEYWNTFLEFAKMRETPFKGTYKDGIEEVKSRIRKST